MVEGPARHVTELARHVVERFGTFCDGPASVRLLYDFQGLKKPQFRTVFVTSPQNHYQSQSNRQTLS